LSAREQRRRRDLIVIGFDSTAGFVAPTNHDTQSTHLMADPADRYARPSATR
jgi:hypothetical protein